MAGGIDADGTCGPLAIFGQRGQFVFDLGQARGQGFQQASTGLGGGDTAGGAGQQAHAQSLFQPAHGVAEGGLGDTQLGGCFGEAAFAGDVDEGLQVVEVFTRHEGMIRPGCARRPR
ncbi:hypothetical protein D3C72_1948540 [compost metagenome]